MTIVLILLSIPCIHCLLTVRAYSVRVYPDNLGCTVYKIFVCVCLCVLCLAPGHNFSLETAPFKLTSEYIDVMGGINSAGFNEYKALCHAAFLIARKHAPIVIGLLEIMSMDSNLPAFMYEYPHRHQPYPMHTVVVAVVVLLLLLCC